MSSVKLYQGDCVDYLHNCSQVIDLIVTDPPYLMNYRSNRRVVKDKFDYIANDQNSYDLITEVFKESSRVLKDGGAIYAFCSWHHVDYFKQEFEKFFKLKNIIIWNKNNHGSGDLKGAYAPKYEMILYGCKGRHILNGKRIPDVIDCDKVSSVNLTHPTEKPQELLKTFIEKSSQPGDTILDPFMGTGSCGLACKELGRNFIGIELDENYFHIAKERLK